ncbi:titin-like [Corythoichthys intestinalis]|uniref:titin-like n=1 Tax=Corythoichthys intestinalis TaxID=161448 RepID=UPI0025A579A4|nr:titin-like [Corythoichthys intestinalis]
MGDAQSTFEDGETPGLIAPEEDRDTLLKNNGQIAGKSDTPLGDVNDICEDDKAENNSSEKLPNVETLLQNVTAVENESNKETEEEEEISLEVIEVEAKQNDINESFKTFFSKVGLKFTLKRGSRDQGEIGADGPESTEDENLADGTQVPTDLENSQTEAGGPDEEWTHIDTPAELDTSSPSCANEEAPMSPIKKFFTTGIFAGLQKKRVSLEEEIMTREMFLQTAEETAEDQKEDTQSSQVPFEDTEDNPSTEQVSEPETPKEMENVPSSPLKRLLLGSRLMMLKRQKDEKEGEEPKSIGASDQPDVAENNANQNSAPPAEDEESPWTTFKKLLSPKKRANRPISNDDNVQNSKDELLPNQEDHVDKDKKRKDSWDPVKRGISHPASELDAETTPVGVNDAEAVEHDEHAKVSAGEGAMSSAQDEVESAWDTFKRLMSPKRKAKPLDQGLRSPVQEDMQENLSFSARFFPDWKKRKSISNKDQETPLGNDDRELAAGDVTSETPAVVPSSNYNRVKVEAKETDDTSIKADAQFNQDLSSEVTEPAHPSDEESRQNAEASENQGTDEDSVEFTAFVGKALSDITEEGDFTESTVAEDLIEPLDHEDSNLSDDSEMISRLITPGPTTRVLQKSQVQGTQEYLQQVEGILEAELQSSNEIVCCGLSDTLQTVGEDRQAPELQKPIATDIPRTDIDVNETEETESFEVITMTEMKPPVLTEEINTAEITAPISTENLGTMTSFISTTDLDSEEIVTSEPREDHDTYEIVTSVPTENSVTEEMTHPNTTQLKTKEMAAPVLTDSQEMTSPIPSKELDKEIGSPTSTEQHETEELAAPIPTEDLSNMKMTTLIPTEGFNTEEIRLSTPTKEEMTPPILPLEADTRLRSRIPSVELDSEGIKPENATEELPTEENVPEIHAGTSNLEEIAPLSTTKLDITGITPHILTEEIDTQEMTPLTGDLDTKEITTSLPTEKLNINEVMTTVPTDDLGEEMTLVEECDKEEMTPPIPTEKIKTSLPTEDIHAREMETNVLTEEPHTQEDTTPGPTNDLDAKENATPVLTEEIDSQEATTPVPTEELKKEEIRFPPEEITLILSKKLDAKETTPASSKKLDVERTVSATEQTAPPTTEEITPSIPSEELTTQEHTSLIAAEEIRPSPSKEHDPVNMTHPTSSKRLDTEKITTSLPTEDLNTKDIPLSIPTMEFDSKNIMLPILSEELEEIMDTEEEIEPLISTEEITLPALIKEFDTQEVVSPILIHELHEEEISPPSATEEEDTEETMPPIPAVELDIKEMAAPVPSEELTTFIPAEVLNTLEESPSIPTQELATKEIAPLTFGKKDTEEVVPPVLQKELNTQELTSPIPTDELHNKEMRPPTPTEEQDTEQNAPSISTVELDSKEIPAPIPTEALTTEELMTPIPTGQLYNEVVGPPTPNEEQDTEEPVPPISAVELDSKEIPAAIPTEVFNTLENTFQIPTDELHNKEMKPPTPTDEQDTEEHVPPISTVELDSKEIPTAIPTEVFNTLENTFQIPTDELHNKEMRPLTPPEEQDTEQTAPTISIVELDSKEIQAPIPAEALTSEELTTAIPTEQLHYEVVGPPTPTEEQDTEEPVPPISTVEVDSKEIPAAIPTEVFNTLENTFQIPTDELHNNETRPLPPTEEQDTEQTAPSILTLELDSKEIQAPIPAEALTSEELTTAIPTEQLHYEVVGPPTPTEEQDTEEPVPPISTVEVDSKEIPAAIPPEVFNTLENTFEIPTDELHNNETRPLPPTEEQDTEQTAPSILTLELDSKEIQAAIPTEVFNTLENTFQIPTDELHNNETRPLPPTEEQDTKQTAPSILTLELDSKEIQAPIPAEALTSEELTTAIPTEQLHYEVVGPPTPTEEQDTEEPVPPISTVEVDSKEISAAIPTEVFNTLENTFEIPTDELHNKEMKPPTPTEEQDTEEHVPPISTVELDSKEIPTAIPTEVFNTLENTFQIPIDELYNKETRPLTSTEEQEAEQTAPSISTLELDSKEIQALIPAETLTSEELTTAIPTEQLHYEVVGPPTPTEEQDTEEPVPPISTVELDSKEIPAAIPTEVFNTLENTFQIPTDELHNKGMKPPTPTEEQDTEEHVPPISTMELDSKEIPAAIPTEVFNTLENTFEIPTDELHNKEMKPPTPTEEQDTEEHVPPISTVELDSKEIPAAIPTKVFNTLENTFQIPTDELHNKEMRPLTPTEEQDTEQMAPSISTVELDSKEIQAPIPAEALISEELTIAIPTEQVHNEVVGLPTPTEEQDTEEHVPPISTVELDSKEIPAAIPTEVLNTLENTFQIPPDELDTKKIAPPIPNDNLDTDTVLLKIPSEMSDREETTRIQTEELDQEEVNPSIPTEILDLKEISSSILSSNLDTKELPDSILTGELYKEEIEEIRSLIPTEEQDPKELGPPILTVELDTKEITALISTEVLKTLENTPQFPSQELDTPKIVPDIPIDEPDKDTIELKTDLEGIKPGFPIKELDLEEVNPPIHIEQLNLKEMSPSILTKELNTKEISPSLPTQELGREEIILPILSGKLDTEDIVAPIPIEKLVAEKIQNQELDTKEITPENIKAANQSKSENIRDELASIDKIYEFVNCLTDVKQSDSENKDISSEAYQSTNQSGIEAPKVDSQESVSIAEPENREGPMEQLQIKDRIPVVDEFKTLGDLQEDTTNLLKETDAIENSLQAIAKHSEDQGAKVVPEHGPEAFTKETAQTTESSSVAVLEAEVISDEPAPQLVEDEIFSEEATEDQQSISIKTKKKHQANEPVDASKNVHIQQIESVESEKSQTELADQFQKATAILLETEAQVLQSLGIAVSVAAQETKFEPETVDIQHVEIKENIHGKESLMKNIKEEHFPFLESDCEPEEKDQKASQTSEFECQTEPMKEEQEDLSATIQEISQDVLAEETMIAQVKYENAALTEDAPVQEDQKIGDKLIPYQEVGQESALNSAIPPQATKTKETEEETVPELLESTKDNRVNVDTFDIVPVKDIEKPGLSLLTESAEAVEIIFVEEKMTENLKKENVDFTEVQPESDEMAEDEVKIKLKPQQAVVAQEETVSKSIAEERTVLVEFKDKTIPFTEVIVEPQGKGDDAVDEKDNTKAVKFEVLASEEAKQGISCSQGIAENILAEESLISEPDEEAKHFPEVPLEQLHKDEKQGTDRTEAIAAECAQTGVMSSLRDQAGQLEKDELIEESIIPNETFIEEISKPQTETKPQPDQAFDEEDPEQEKTADELLRKAPMKEENRKDGTEQVGGAHASLHQEETSCAEILEKIIYENLPTISGVTADQAKLQVYPTDMETRINLLDQLEVTTATAEHALVTQMTTCRYKEITISLPDVPESPTGMREALPVSDVRAITETALTEAPLTTDIVTNIAKMGTELMMMHAPAMEVNHSVQRANVDILLAEKSVGQPLEVGVREDKAVFDVCLESVEQVSISKGVEVETCDDNAVIRHEIFPQVNQSQLETLKKLVLKEAEEVEHVTDDGSVRHEVETHEDNTVIRHDVFPHINQTQLESLKKLVLEEAEEVKHVTDDGSVRHEQRQTEERTVLVEFKDEAIPFTEVVVEPQGKGDDVVDGKDNTKAVKSEVLASEEAKQGISCSQGIAENILAEESLIREPVEEAEHFPEVPLEQLHKGEKQGTDRTQVNAAECAQTEVISSLRDQAGQLEKDELIEESIIPNETFIEEISKPQTETKPQPDQAFDEENPEQENTADELLREAPMKEQNQKDGIEQVGGTHASLHQEETSCAEILEKIIYENLPTISGVTADQAKLQVDPTDMETRIDLLDQLEVTTATAEHALVTQMTTCRYKEITISLPDVPESPTGMREALPVSDVRAIIETALTEAPLTTDIVTNIAKMGTELMMMHAPAIEVNHSVQRANVDILLAENSAGQPLEVGVREDKAVFDVCLESVEQVSISKGVEVETCDDNAVIRHEIFPHVNQSQLETLKKLVLEEAEEVEHVTDDGSVRHEVETHEDNTVIRHEVFPHVNQTQLEILEQVVLKEAEEVKQATDDGTVRLLLIPDNECPPKSEDLEETSRQEAMQHSLEIPQSQDKSEERKHELSKSEDLGQTIVPKMVPQYISAQSTSVSELEKESSTQLLEAVAPTTKVVQMLLVEEEPSSQTDSHEDRYPVKESPMDEDVSQSPEALSQTEQDRYQGRETTKEDSQTPVREKTSSGTHTEETISPPEPLDGAKCQINDDHPTEVGALAPETQHINTLDIVVRHEDLIEGLQTLLAEESSSQVPPQNVVTEVCILTLDSVELVSDHKQGTTRESVHAQESEEPFSQKRPVEEQTPAAISNESHQELKAQEVLSSKDSTEIQREIELSDEHESLANKESTETQTQMELIEGPDQQGEYQGSLAPKEYAETQNLTELSQEHDERRENQTAIAQNEYVETQEHIELSEEHDQQRENKESSAQNESIENWKQMAPSEEHYESRKNQTSTAQNEYAETQKQIELSEEHDQPRETQESLTQKRSKENLKQMEPSEEHDEPRENQGSSAQKETADTQKQMELLEEDQQRENQESSSQNDCIENWKQMELSEEHNEPKGNQESLAQKETIKIQEQMELSEVHGRPTDNQESLAQKETINIQEQMELPEGHDKPNDNQESFTEEVVTRNQKEVEPGENQESLTPKNSTENDKVPEIPEPARAKEKILPKYISEKQTEAEPTADGQIQILPFLETSKSAREWQSPEILVTADTAVLLKSVLRPMETVEAVEETFPALTLEATQEIQPVETMQAVYQILLISQDQGKDTGVPVKEADDEQDIWMDAEEDIQIQEDADVLLPQDGNFQCHGNLEVKTALREESHTLATPHPEDQNQSKESAAPDRPETPPDPKEVPRVSSI